MRLKILCDKTTSGVMFTLSALSLLLVFVIGAGLVVRSMPVFEGNSLWGLVSSSNWSPSGGEFGFWAFISGTLWVTFIAILWALPVALLTALFLTEEAKAWFKKLVYPVLDILAGLPSVIYGVWGVLVLVPLVSEHIAPVFVDYSTGYTVLTAGVVLGIMILPMIVSLFVELFAATPQELREASLSLGATRWQTTKLVVLRKNVPAMVAVVVLSISRAMGETMAVLMVCGNIAQVPSSPLDGGYPIPALIANNYGEMLSVPMYDSALMFSALLLFVLVLVFNIASKLILKRIENKFC